MAATKGLLNKPTASVGGKPVKGSGGRGGGRRNKQQAYYPGQQSYEGLNPDQNRTINQRMQGDVGLGDAANSLMPGIQGAYQQPFDWSQLPTAPWQQGQDVKGMAQGYQDQVYENFARTADPEFKRQADDFEQQMANRGIPMGSDLYNQQKKALLDAQEGQRQDMRTQALQGSDAYATNWNNLGTQNYQNAYTMAGARRDMPLNDYNKLYGATSGFAAQNLGYSQGLGLQNDAQNADMALFRASHSGGGGGGGGGGSGSGGYSDKYGFATPQEYDAYKVAMDRANKQWEWSNNPQYNQPTQQQPNPWASFSGMALGTGLGLLSKSIF